MNLIHSYVQLTKMLTNLVMISKTQIDSSFLSGQFFYKSYETHYSLHGNVNSDGILLYVREIIPLMLSNFQLTIIGVFIEINF